MFRPIFREAAMRRITCLALIASLAFAAPVQAADLSGMGANIYGNYFAFTKANLDDHPVQKITAGKVDVALQRTKLSDLKKAFGGTVQSNGDATWLCYRGDGTNNWFISNDQGGQEFVMMVAVEASSSTPADCEAVDGFPAVTFDVPGIGAKSADIKAKFGDVGGSGSKLAFRANKPGGYTDNAQYLGYVLKGGTVSGIGVGESPIPTQH